MNDDKVYVPRENGTQRIAVSATGAKTALRTELLGVGWVRLLAVGADIDVQFGASDVTQVVKDATASDGTVGFTLLNGLPLDYYLTSETHVSWDASGAGYLVISAAGRKRVGV